MINTKKSEYKYAFFPKFSCSILLLFNNIYPMICYVFITGATYIAEHLPANLSDGGDLVQVEITFVVLDHPELKRGDMLEFNATSVFSYVEKPIPPSSIFIENCTCTKPLVEFFEPEALKDCICENYDLYNVTYDGCFNCTSLFDYEDEGYENYQNTTALTCNCINFCYNNTEYFLNPSPIVNFTSFAFDECDCALVSALGDHEDNITLLLHAEQCMEPFLYNYTCTDLTYMVTHHKIDLEALCTCHNLTNGNISTLQCSCAEDHFSDQVKNMFGPLKHEVIECTGVVDMINKTNDGYQPYVFHSDYCVCHLPTSAPLLQSGVNQISTNFTSDSSTTPLPTISANQTDELVEYGCLCDTFCTVHVEQHCEEGSTHPRCSDLLDKEIRPLNDSRCECLKRYNNKSLSLYDILSWYQDLNANFSRVNISLSSNSVSNITVNATVNGTTASPVQVPPVSDLLDCNCFDVNKLLTHIEPGSCKEIPPLEFLDCECYVPPDNETQYILDNWDENATIINQMVTEIAHTTVVIEPELQITFEREPEPSIVDSIDPVQFRFKIKHTKKSDAPAYNVTLQLDAINFTITAGDASFSICPDLWACDHIFYDNDVGRFHIPFLPVDPAGVIFHGYYNLSVGNYIDFVADSLIVATGIAWYDSCIVDYPGRLYDSIVAFDTVRIDAPTISAELDLTTAYAYMFFSNEFGKPPTTFSIGDLVRIQANLWIPEITLHLDEFSIQGNIPNMTVSSGKILLSEQIYHRNDTDSIFLEFNETGVELTDGAIYPDQKYNYSAFLDDGFTTVPGV